MSIRPLSAALRKKAEEELNETPSRITTDIQILRDWLGQQPHLHSLEPTDQWLVAFLRGCKYNIEKAKGKIDMYYKFKATIPEFYADRDPLDPGIQVLLKLGVFLPLRNCIKEDSPRIILLRQKPLSHSAQNLATLIKLILMIFEILLLEDDNFCIAGEDVVVDFDGLSFNIVWQWTPSFAWKVISCVEKALSVRVKSLHFLNAPFFIAPGVKLLKMIVGTKIKDRIYAHNKDGHSLYDYVNKSVLPEEYGGTDGNLQELIDYWKAKVESYRNWFLEENSCSDESKRPKKANSGKPSTTVDLRSMDID